MTRGRRQAVASLLTLALAAGCGLDPEAVPRAVLDAPPVPDTGRGPPAGKRPRIILLIVVDTLRADHVGAYGSEQDLTPRIDALAERSFLFEQAIAPSSWTRSTVASLFTARYPSSVRVLGREDALADEHLTLAEILSQAGGETGGWETRGIYTNGNVSEKFGFGQGFDSYRQTKLKRGYPGDFQMMVAEGVTNAALDLLAAREQSQQVRPLFLYLHYTDPHDPYLPHPGLLPEPEPRGRFDGSRRGLNRMLLTQARGGLTKPDRQRIKHLYAGEVRYCDQSIGRLLKGIELLGVADDTLIVLTADHGEGLWDHGERAHAVGLHEEQIRVPLILHYPGMKPGHGGRIQQAVSLVDVAPTLLAAAGVGGELALEGHDLEPLARGRPRPRVFDYIYSELTLDRFDTESLRFGSLKLIRTRGSRNPPVSELYDLSSDPRERHNLAQHWVEDADAEQLGQVLTAWQRELRARSGPAATRSTESLDRNTREQLEGLGYLEPE